MPVASTSSRASPKRGIVNVWLLTLLAMIDHSRFHHGAAWYVGAWNSSKATPVRANLGNLARAQRQQPQALEAYRTALATLEAVIAKNPTDVRIRKDAENLRTLISATR